MTSVSSLPWLLEDPEPQGNTNERLLKGVPDRMAYDFTWDDVVEVIELYLDPVREDGVLVVVGRYVEEEPIGTLFWTGPTLHGVIWRGLASERSPEWRNSQQTRLRTRLERKHGGLR